MTPTKQQQGCNKRVGSPTRYSILSDPRLSQLFALSSQLEALAHSIDVQPASVPVASMQQQPVSSPTQNSKMAEPKQQQFLNNNNSLMIGSAPSLGNNGKLVTSEDHQDTSVKYRRLEDESLDENGDNEIGNRS